MKYLLPILLFLSTALEAQEKKYYLSLCAIFQNEGRFLKEWVEYYQLLGVEHFWLYNNNSTDNYLEILEPYIENGLVELIEWPSERENNEWISFPYRVQIDAYNDAIKRSREKTEWLAIVDLDEFILPVNENTISECLSQHYYDEAGVYIQWLIFGTSNVKFIKQNELKIEKLTKRALISYKKNIWRKSIVKPSCVRFCKSPHDCRYIPGKNHVSSNLDIIRINHYWAGDEYYLHNVKIPRQQKWGFSKEDVLRDAAECSIEEDTLIQRFVPELKERCKIY